jgi:hypothetical protein
VDENDTPDVDQNVTEDDTAGHKTRFQGKDDEDDGDDTAGHRLEIRTDPNSKHPDFVSGSLSSDETAPKS